MNKLTLILEPHDYQIYYVNISMEFQPLRCKCLSWRNVPSGEQGQMAVFAGSDEDNLTDIFNNYYNCQVSVKFSEPLLACQNYRIQGVIGSFLF